METNISLYQNLTVIFGIAGGIMLVLSIVLFIVFDMKHIIGKTLGLSEKQAIKRMNTKAKAEEKARKKKKALAAGGGSAGKSAARSQETGAAAGKSQVSGRENEITDVPAAKMNAEDEATDILAARPEAEDEATDVLTAEPNAADGATDVLAVEPNAEDGATDVLAVEPSAADGATDVLAGSEKENAVRTFTDAPAGWEPIETGDTTVLNENPATAVLSANHPTIKNTQFMLIRHIMLIHTEELI